MEKSEDFIQWEKFKRAIDAIYKELSRIFSELIAKVLEKAVEVRDFLIEAATYEKPKLPKTDFTRSRITHQNFDRKPRFAVRKILK